MAATTVRTTKTNAAARKAAAPSVNNNGRVVGAAVRKGVLATTAVTLSTARVGGSWLSGFAAGLMGK